ncbi:uncharacterized protein LOC117235164 isoform X4 [Bombus vosnesenskii]|uniref:Uncharacterized protein LOC117235164 isoform X4 n=2 Tax=Pyrobombus TaxID=144703 RepID=A0A6J3KI71_9HYME|nr:uncharacterized protein LOC100743584 isoform X4 [Bombus impatiens]XP_033352828.1 uncharacterized protein LOC117235164 isoform X4 [Bombus vosnesenskii]
MAIMQSCCCWRSVRRGSFACAIYSGIYFTVLALTTGKVLQGESQYLRGNRSLPESTSFLEPDTISPTTVRFNVTLLICSCCGVICSILLLYGLCKDQRVFLIPWIIVIVTICFIDVGHSLYLFIAASTFDPTKVMLYTLNFFLLCLNVPAVRYAIQPPTTTATSCLSSRRAPTNNETKATATPTQSPTTGQNTLSLEKSPVTGRPSRKHVQFPDTAPDSQNGKSEVPITMLVLQMEAENEHATSSTSLKLEEATIDQVLLSQKNSYSQHT